MPAEPVPSVPGVPVALRWRGQAVRGEVAEGALSIVAGARTDWFVDPGTGTATVTAPALLGELPGDFTLAARVDVAFRVTYDAGALVVWRSERRWAKLALERSPQGRPMIVSVVTREHSDDCNSCALESDALWLRVSAIGEAHAFHASADGVRWELVRHFRLGGAGVTETGFQAQSPLGEGCIARFSHIRHRATTLTDLRNGD